MAGLREGSQYKGEQGMKLIHRAALNGGAVCKANEPRVNCSGVLFTCHECLRITTPLTREQAMEQIRVAAKRGA